MLSCVVIYHFLSFYYNLLSYDDALSESNITTKNKREKNEGCSTYHRAQCTTLQVQVGVHAGDVQCTISQGECTARDACPHAMWRTKITHLGIKVVQVEADGNVRGAAGCGTGRGRRHGQGEGGRHGGVMSLADHLHHPSSLSITDGSRLLWSWSPSPSVIGGRRRSVVDGHRLSSSSSSHLLSVSLVCRRRHTIALLYSCEAWRPGMKSRCSQRAGQSMRRRQGKHEVNMPLQGSPTEGKRGGGPEVSKACHQRAGANQRCIRGRRALSRTRGNAGVGAMCRRRRSGGNVGEGRTCGRGCDSRDGVFFGQVKELVEATACEHM